MRASSMRADRPTSARIAIPPICSGPIVLCAQIEAASALRAYRQTRVEDLATKCPEHCPI
jgi:hypothetical protein